MLQGAPARIQGTVDRENGRQELYRAAFFRLSPTAAPAAIEAKRRNGVRSASGFSIAGMGA